MVSAPASPVKSDDKENIPAKLLNTNKTNPVTRRHSLAPPKSILKNPNKTRLFESDTMNQTVAIMQRFPSNDLQYQTIRNTAANRRVSFAPEVTLHKIDVIPQYFEPSPKRQPRRRDTLQFIPPVRIDNDDFEERGVDESSDMDIDEDNDNEDENNGSNLVMSKSPFVIFQDNNDDDYDQNEEDEFDSLFDEVENNDMELATHYGNLKVDEIDKLNSRPKLDDETGVQQEEMQLTRYQDEVIDEGDMELTEQIKSGSVDFMSNQDEPQNGNLLRDIIPTTTDSQQSEELMDENLSMELTVYQDKKMAELVLENDQANDPKAHQDLEVSEPIEDQEMMDLTEHLGKKIDNNDDMEMTVYRGMAFDEKTNQELPPQEPQNSESLPLAQSTQSQLSQPELATKQLSTITEFTEAEEEMEQPVMKNPTMVAAQKESRSSFDSSDVEDDDIEAVEPTTVAFGDPSIFLDILRVTGGSQDEDNASEPFTKAQDIVSEPVAKDQEIATKLVTNDQDIATKLVTNDQDIATELFKNDQDIATEPVTKDDNVPLTTIAKRAYSTPRKSLTTDDGSPHERSSSLKKRKLSFTPSGKTVIPATNLESPTVMGTENMQHQVSASTSSTPLKDSLLFESPEHPNIEKMIEALTPNRLLKKRDSFIYVSQSPRRRSISDEANLTPLRAVKEIPNGSLNLQQAVVTTTVPLTGNDESQIMEDVTDDYIPVDLKTFLRATNVRFFDDLSVKDTSMDLKLTKYDKESVDLKEYVIGLQKLKQLELLNFSCNELRKNINEGRELFATIEREIQDENPPLIREYFEANPQVQNTMNLQFQEIKSYARQQAKTVWYGWRSKLVEGVHQGLLLNRRVLEDSKLKIDTKIEVFTGEQKRLMLELESLKTKFEKMMKHKLQFEDCDKEKLIALRKDLIIISDKCTVIRSSLQSLIDESINLESQLLNLTEKVDALYTEIDQINGEIKNNQLYDQSDIAKLKLKFAVLERVTSLRLQKLDSQKIIMLIDNVKITLDSVDGTSEYQFSETHSMIINKFQPILLENITSTGVDKIVEFLQNYHKLKKLNDKFEKLRLYSNDIIKFQECDQSIAVVIKEVRQSYKRIISFKIDANLVVSQQISLKDLSVKSLDYLGFEKDDRVASCDDNNDVGELEMLLRQVQLI